MDLDLSWCTTTADASTRKNLYVYLGTTDSYTDLHMVVRFSYSADQLKTGNLLDYADCSPIQRFKDLSRLFNKEVNRPLLARTAAFNKTYTQDTILYPCGFRALTSLQRTPNLTLSRSDPDRQQQQHDANNRHGPDLELRVIELRHESRQLGRIHER